MMRAKNKMIEWDELLRYVAEQQQGGDERDFRNILDEMMGAEVERRKEKAKQAIDPDKCVDLTETKGDRIKEELMKTNNAMIGSFLLKLGRKENCFSPNLYEVANNLHQSIKWGKDDRFASVPWKGEGQISLDKLVEIVRWLQMITNMSIFL
jgi:hypothetical protein